MVDSTPSLIRRTGRIIERVGRWLAIAILLLASSMATAGAVKRPPNIVLIIGDDHGWAHSGFMGHPIVETPHLDTLADEGTLFTQAQLPASVCRPTLQTLLTGLHPRQWEAKRVALSAARPIPFREEVQHYRTLPGELARRGYRSWEGGKMWEGTFEQAGFSDGMARTRPLGIFGNEGENFGRDGWQSDRCGDTRTSDAPCPALAPVRDFLDETGDAPFFLWFAPMLPHVPFDPPPEFLERYQGRPIATLAELVYYAQVTRLDAVVGELLRELDARGLRDDTLVIYVSDNGWEVGQGFFGALGHGKGSLHELGTRTPIIFRWPGRVPEGATREMLVAVDDLFPTLLDYAGAEQLPDRDGSSLRPLIEQRETTGRATYVSSFDGLAPEYRGHFVRTDQWRYMDFEDGHDELFDVRDDPFEQVDLVAARPDVVASMRQAIVDWEREIRLPAPRLEIVGRLITHDRRPIPDASLLVESAGQTLEVITGPNGEFRFANLFHGTHTITRGRGLSALIDATPVAIPIGTTGSQLGEIIGVENGDATGTVRQRGMLSGRVVTIRGAPLADTIVRLRGRNQRKDVTVVVRTDERGRYLAENLPVGRYGVEAEVAPGFEAKRRIAAVRSWQRRDHDILVRAIPRPARHDRKAHKPAPNKLRHR